MTKLPVNRNKPVGRSITEADLSGMFKRAEAVKASREAAGVPIPAAEPIASPPKKRTSQKPAGRP